MNNSRIDPAKREFLAKYVTEEAYPKDIWFILDLRSGDFVDIADASGKVVTRVPLAVAIRIIEARNEFQQMLEQS